MGGGILVVSVLSTKAPMASLPKGAFFGPVIRTILVALKTIQECEFGSPTSLAKYTTTF